MRANSCWRSILSSLRGTIVRTTFASEAYGSSRFFLLLRGSGESSTASSVVGGFFASAVRVLNLLAGSRGDDRGGGGGVVSFAPATVEVLLVSDTSPRRDGNGDPKHVNLVHQRVFLGSFRTSRSSRDGKRAPFVIIFLHHRVFLRVACTAASDIHNCSCKDIFRF